MRRFVSRLSGAVAVGVVAESVCGGCPRRFGGVRWFSRVGLKVDSPGVVGVVRGSVGVAAGAGFWLPAVVAVALVRKRGIVWHHPDGRMAKVKVRDFP